MVKRSEKGVVFRLIRQTSRLFMEIPPRSLKTEFKCHLRLSNGHRAGGDPSKRLGDKRPLLNMAGLLRKVRRPGRAEERPSLAAPAGSEPPLPRGRPLRVGRGLRGVRGVVIQLLLCRIRAPAPPAAETQPERWVRVPLTAFCPLPSGVCKSELRSY